MKFLVQTINHKVVHDFAFAMERSKEYYEWLGKEECNIFYVNNLDFDEFLGNHRDPYEYIPVGSVEFVSEYVKKYYPDFVSSLEPINIPLSLSRYAHQLVYDFPKDINPNVIDKSFFIPGKEYFRKSLDTIKDPTNGLFKYNSVDDILGYQISNRIDIYSEWRVFVFHNEVQHIANYSGDCLMFPEKEFIKNVIDEYKDESPAAYTLDIGMNALERHPFIIEIHRFFSCGLYGFSDYNKLPKMFSQTWFEMIHKR